MRAHTEMRADAAGARPGRGRLNALPRVQARMRVPLENVEERLSPTRRVS